MLQTPTALRSTFSEQPEGLRISIPPPRQVFPAIFLLFWLSFWLWGGSNVIGKQAHDPFGDLFSLIWLCFWVVGSAFAVFAWFWNLFGCTILTVRPDSLSLRQTVFGIGRTRTFTTSDMFNLRFVPEYGGGKHRHASHIAFDYGAKTWKIAGEIQEPEANMIIHKVLERAAIRTSSSYTEL
jgi:hypothetical protein